MDDFEQQLKRAMARTDPPAWFEAKVLAAARRRPAAKRRFWRLDWAAAALASVLVVSGVVWQHEREERERRLGEEACAKLELALKITRQKLQFVERQIESVQQGN
jgi:hypothetical protein